MECVSNRLQKHDCVSKDERKNDNHHLCVSKEPKNKKKEGIGQAYMDITETQMCVSSIQEH